MLKLGHVVLPVHDSFIVRNSASQELDIIMKRIFEEEFGKKAKLKVKKTVLEEPNSEEIYENRALIMDLEILRDYESTYYSKAIRIWGL